MTDETDTTSEVARVLGDHYPEQTSYDAGELHGCHCGWEVPQRPSLSMDGDRAAYWAHQAEVLKEAGVLRGDGPKRIGRNPGTLYVEIEVTPHEWATRGETFDTWYEATPEQAVAALRSEANRWAAEYGLPQIATQEPAGAPGVDSAGRGASGGLGERLRSAADYQDRPGAYDELRAMADEVEAAYRVADAEIARLSEFHDHYRAQVERVRALAEAWMNAQTLNRASLARGELQVRKTPGPEDFLAALDATPEPVLNAGDEEAGQ